MYLYLPVNGTFSSDPAEIIPLKSYASEKRQSTYIDVDLRSQNSIRRGYFAAFNRFNFYRNGREFSFHAWRLLLSLSLARTSKAFQPPNESGAYTEIGANVQVDEIENILKFPFRRYFLVSSFIVELIIRRRVSIAVETLEKVSVRVDIREGRRRRSLGFVAQTRYKFWPPTNLLLMLQNLCVRLKDQNGRVVKFEKY